MNRGPKLEQIPEPTIGDKLWSKAVEELGTDHISLVLAYQAGKADAAKEILATTERKAHDAALDIIIESRQLEGE